MSPRPPPSRPGPSGGARPGPVPFGPVRSNQATPFRFGTARPAPPSRGGGMASFLRSKISQGRGSGIGGSKRPTAQPPRPAAPRAARRNQIRGSNPSPPNRGSPGSQSGAPKNLLRGLGAPDRPLRGPSPHRHGRPALFMVYRRVMALVNTVDQQRIAPAMARVNAILDDVKDVTAKVRQEVVRVDEAMFRRSTGSTTPWIACGGTCGQRQAAWSAYSADCA